MTIDTSKLRISKTTIQGILQLAIVCLISYIALPPKTGAAAICLALCKAILAYFQKDAGEQEVVTPSGEKQVKPSYENPADPTDTPVVKP